MKKEWRNKMQIKTETFKTLKISENEAENLKNICVIFQNYIEAGFYCEEFDEEQIEDMKPVIDFILEYC